MSEFPPRDYLRSAIIAATPFEVSGDTPMGIWQKHGIGRLSGTVALLALMHREGIVEMAPMTDDGLIRYWRSGGEEKRRWESGHYG